MVLMIMVVVVVTIMVVVLMVVVLMMISKSYPKLTSVPGHLCSDGTPDLGGSNTVQSRAQAAAQLRVLQLSRRHYRARWPRKETLGGKHSLA